MLEGEISEAFHATQLQASAQAGGMQFGYVGYIQTYDVGTNTVTVLNPANADPDQLANGATPTPMVSAPMALGTNMSCFSGVQNPINTAIRHWGIQLCPIGGGSLQQPTQGEQVLVMHLNQNIGYGIATAFLFTEVTVPPGADPIPVSGARLQPGEWLAIHPSGNTVHITRGGDFNIYVQQPQDPDVGTGNLTVGVDGGISLNTNTDLGANPPAATMGDIDLLAARDENLTAIRDVNLTAGRNVTISGAANVFIDSAVRVNVTAPIVNVVSPDINLGTNALAFLELMTAVSLAAYNVHTHPVSGAVTGPPTTPIPVAYPYLTQSTQSN